MVYTLDSFTNLSALKLVKLSSVYLIKPQTAVYALQTSQKKQNAVTPLAKWNGNDKNKYRKF